MFRRSLGIFELQRPLHIAHDCSLASTRPRAARVDRARERPGRGREECVGDLVGHPGSRDQCGDTELRLELQPNPRPLVRLNQPDGRELLVGRMIRHSRECHRSRRLYGDREKQLELLDARPAGDMDHHPYACRLTPRVTLEDPDVPDDVGAPFGVAIDRREQGEALLERCGDIGCGFSVKVSRAQRLPDAQCQRRADEPTPRVVSAVRDTHILIA